MGSAFIRVLGQSIDQEKDIHAFVQSIKESWPQLDKADLVILLYLPVCIRGRSP
jgi:hypothetical protein